MKFWIVQMMRLRHYFIHQEQQEILKGIMLTHQNIGSNSKTLSKCWNFHEDDCLLHALPIYHVHGLFVALAAPYYLVQKCNGWIHLIQKRLFKHYQNALIMMGVPTYYTRLLSSENLNKDNDLSIVYLFQVPPLLKILFMNLNQELVKRYWKGTV